MKITDLTTVPAEKYLFIRVHTDEGITGIGEGFGSWGFIDGTVGVLEKFRQYLVETAGPVPIGITGSLCTAACISAAPSS